MSKEVDRDKLALQVRLQREHRAWTQEELAQKSGLAVRTVQRVESGEFASQLDTVAAIARAFDIGLEALLV